ncbi:hypothetical protein [Falsiroseomonas sp.]|uniref:hypothetical protein n=1 Tax=Falsiroseomonas sp. TaxID=2870721 RepID=UPI003F6F7434
MHPRVDRPAISLPARPRLGGLLLLPLLAACGDVPRDLQPSYWWRNVSGAYLDERLPPPGMTAPYPNLATVPARPVPPDAATRAALTAALAGDREFARTDPASRPASPPGVPAPLPEGAAPPPPPRLAAAPAIRFEAPRPAAPAAFPGAAAPRATVPGAGAPAETIQPRGAPPAPALPEMLGLPPAPTRDLLAPRTP